MSVNLSERADVVNALKQNTVFQAFANGASIVFDALRELLGSQILL